MTSGDTDPFKDSALLKEYEIIQNKIDKYGETSIKLKGFAITLTIALVTISFKANITIYLYITILILLNLLYLEVINKTNYNTLKKQLMKLETNINRPSKRKEVKVLYIAHRINGKNLLSSLNIFKSIKNSYKLFSLYLSLILCMILGIIFFDSFSGTFDKKKEYAIIQNNSLPLKENNEILIKIYIQSQNTNLSKQNDKSKQSYELLKEIKSNSTNSQDTLEVVVDLLSILNGEK